MPSRTAPNRPIATYADFWPYYLNEHARPATRTIHLVGTAVAFLSFCAGLITDNAWYFLAAMAGGYAPAWFAHFFVERNRPATFTYPLWSLVSDFRMAWCWITCQLGRELEKAGVTVSGR
jgi:hypothetical protein